MAVRLLPFLEAYPPPWQIRDREIVDRDGCNVHDIDMSSEEVEFWRGVVDAVNRMHVPWGCFAFAEVACPGHVASAHDPKVCGRCGIHIDELRPNEDDPINLQGSGPAPITAREG